MKSNSSFFKKLSYVPSKIYLSSPPDDLTDDQMFKIFDKNGDGFISSDELKKLMITFGEDLSDAKVNELIKEADTNGDGRVTFEEFKAAMESTW